MGCKLGGVGGDAGEGGEFRDVASGEALGGGDAMLRLTVGMDAASCAIVGMLAIGAVDSKGGVGGSSLAESVMLAIGPCESDISSTLASSSPSSSPGPLSVDLSSESQEWPT